MCCMLIDYTIYIYYIYIFEGGKLQRRQFVGKTIGERVYENELFSLKPRISESVNPTETSYHRMVTRNFRYIQSCIQIIQIQAQIYTSSITIYVFYYMCLTYTIYVFSKEQV